MTREVVVSKALSFLLRHGGDEEGVGIDEGGWANVADVVGVLSSFVLQWLFELIDDCSAVILRVYDLVR